MHGPTGKRLAIIFINSQAILRRPQTDPTCHATCTVPCWGTKFTTPPNKEATDINSWIKTFRTQPIVLFRLWVVTRSPPLCFWSGGGVQWMMIIISINPGKPHNAHANYIPEQTTTTPQLITIHPFPCCTFVSTHLHRVYKYQALLLSLVPGVRAINLQ